MKLSQIVGVEKTVKSETAASLKEAFDRLRRPDLFSGFTRTYRPYDEAGDKLPPERKGVQATVPDVLAQVRGALTELWDLAATKDRGNQEACADIVVGGKVLVPKVPATTLLSLEKGLAQLFEDLKAIPVLDPASEWAPDPSTGLYRTAAVEQQRTKKVPKVVVLHPATEQHPAQTQLLQEDVAVGTWSVVAHSGAMTAVERRVLLTRVSELVKAVTAAREEANTATVPSIRIADKVLGYLFDGK